MGKRGLGERGRRVDAQRPRAETAPTRQTAHLGCRSPTRIIGPSDIEPIMRMARSAMCPQRPDEVDAGDVLGLSIEVRLPASPPEEGRRCL